MDLAFFLTETEASPKHVGGLMIFKKPAGAGDNFVAELAEDFRRQSQATAPFNSVIHVNRFGVPGWQEAADFAIDDHIHVHTLPIPGSRVELYQLVGDLHTPKLERDKPLWEFHLIDGVKKGRFAIYTKMHHAYADGVSMTAWMTKSLADDPKDKTVRAVWNRSRSKSRKTGSEGISLMSVVKQLSSSYMDQLRMVAGLSKLSTQLMLEQMHLTKNAVAVPFRASHNTPLTGQVSAGRQIATASVPMERVNRIRKLTRSSLNHVALSCVDGALHRYLEDCGSDLEQPITIQMPVNLRQEGDQHGGNKIGIVLVDLARKTEDPYERLREIGFTLRNVRYQVDGVPASSVMAYTVILGAIAQLTELLGLSDSLPPLGNTLVSNVPGPRQTQYLKGATLEDMFPISTLPPSNLMNITLFSYDKNLHFGLVATQDLPELNRLGDYIHQAFLDLEDAVAPQATEPAYKN